MKNPYVITAIVIVILAAAYYFFVYKKQQDEKAAGSGTEKSNFGGKPCSCTAKNPLIKPAGRVVMMYDQNGTPVYREAGDYCKTSGGGDGRYIPDGRGGLACGSANSSSAY